MDGDQIRDPVRHDARFTGAGAGHDEEGAFGVLNGFFLPAAKFGKYVDLGSHKKIVAVSRSVTGIVWDGC